MKFLKSGLFKKKQGNCSEGTKKKKKKEVLSEQALFQRFVISWQRKKDRSWQFIGRAAAEINVISVGHGSLGESVRMVEM